MTPPQPAVIIRHGTTLQRARLIEANGPDAYYVEPNSGGRRWDPPGFSTCRADRPCNVGTPEQYARWKAVNFPNEGGPAVLEVEVPADIIAVLEADPVARAKMNSGDTCFDPAAGIAELLAAWLGLVKRVIII